jgi:hypothetical protein
MEEGWRTVNKILLQSIHTLQSLRHLLNPTKLHCAFAGITTRKVLDCSLLKTFQVVSFREGRFLIPQPEKLETVGNDSPPILKIHWLVTQQETSQVHSYVQTYHCKGMNWNPNGVSLWCLFNDRFGAVSIASGYGLETRGVGVQVPVGSRISTSPRRPARLWGPPSLLFNGYPFYRGETTGNSWSVIRVRCQ